MMSPLRCLAIIGLALCVSTGLGQQPRCNHREAIRAEVDAEMPRSWDDLYKSYTLYRRCDDGAIGEGYSESVARILVDHWKTLPRLAQLASKDADFRRFVLKHVDETLVMEDIQRIKANAENRCPIGLRDLCHDLRKQPD
jgi:hypothetical protein